MVACTKAKTNCTRDLEKSVEASYIWLDSCVSQGGALTNGLPFYQRANWPREMSFLSQGQGYPAFVANFTIRRAGFSFWLFVSTGNHFATRFLYKMSFSEKNFSNPRQSVIDAPENWKQVLENLKMGLKRNWTKFRASIVQKMQPSVKNCANLVIKLCW